MNELKPDSDPYRKLPVDPEIVKQALADFNAEETLVELRELREQGGYSIDDVLSAFDEAVASHDERAA